MPEQIDTSSEIHDAIETLIEEEIHASVQDRISEIRHSDE
jgi:hypothetical protein